MKTIEKIGAWIILSSQDSTKFSLTVKSSIAYVVAVLAFAHLPNYNLPQVADMLVLVFEQTIQWISATIALYGLYRKFITSWRGTNAVVNDPMYFNQ